MRGPVSEVLVLLLVLTGGEAAGDGSEGAQDEETGEERQYKDHHFVILGKLSL